MLNLTNLPLPTFFSPLKNKKKRNSVEILQPLALSLKVQTYHILKSFLEKKVHISNKIWAIESEFISFYHWTHITFADYASESQNGENVVVSRRRESGINHSGVLRGICLEKRSVRLKPSRDTLSLQLYFFPRHTGLASMRIQKM